MDIRRTRRAIVVGNLALLQVQVQNLIPLANIDVIDRSTCWASGVRAGVSSKTTSRDMVRECSYDSQCYAVRESVQRCAQCIHVILGASVTAISDKPRYTITLW